MTVHDWCKANFENFDDSQIEGMERVKDWPVRGAHLVSSHQSALLQVSCGGDCIIGFVHLAAAGFPLRGSVYIVRDNEAGHVWEVEQRGNNGYPTRPKPAAKLRIVVTG